MTGFHKLRKRKEQLYQEFCLQRAEDMPQRALESLNVSELQGMAERLKAYMDLVEGKRFGLSPRKPC